MIRKIKDKFQSEDNKRILSNTISLSSLQAVNLIFPLITFPYLVSVLGVEKFGLLALSSAVILYLQMITKYGFDLSGVQQISIDRDNKEKVIEIFSSIMSVKFILMILTFIILNIFIFSIEKFSNDWILYYVTFGIVIGDVLFPSWFFQGMEYMKWITYLNIGVRTFFTILIFVYIQSEDDYLYVPILNSIGLILAGLISLYIIKNKFSISFKIQPISNLLWQLKEGWYVFTSSIAVSMYTTFNIILLGYFTNNTIVGYFSIANRLISITVTIINSFIQAIFPNLAKEYINSKKIFYIKFNKIVLYMLPILVFMMILAIILVKVVLPLLIENNFYKIIDIFIILSIMIILVPYGALFTRYLVIIQKTKELNKIVFLSAVINIVSIPGIIYLFQAKGLALFMIVLQLFTILMCINIYKKTRGHDE